MYQTHAKSRRRFLEGMTLGGTAMALGLCPRIAPAAVPEITRIRLPRTPVACLAPTFVAGELLRLEGFEDVQYVDTPHVDAINPALANGEVDFIMNDPPAHLISLQQGAPLVLLAGVHTGCWELFGNDSVKTLADLRGRRVGAPARGSRQAFLAAMGASAGLDPAQDMIWVDHEPGVAMRMFAEGEIDAFLGFPPEPQELRDKGIGHVVVNTLTDRPWSLYFCCMLGTRREFLERYPVATRLALRAFIKATELCIAEPELAARLMVDAGVSEQYEYVLQSVREIGYRNWREYNPEDTIRFWTLRLREAGSISLSPKTVVSEHTDWRLLNDLKREMKV